MNGKKPSKDGGDDRDETQEGDPTAPPPHSTQQDFDLVSLPARKSPPRDTPLPKRKGPETDDFFGAPEETEAHPYDASAGKPRPVDPDASERETREIGEERDLPTVAGDFAASKPAGPPSDAAATVAGHGPASDQETIAAGDSKTEASKPPRPFVSPLSKAAGSRTARDPIVGSAAMGKTHPGAAPAGPHQLGEGQLIADRYELLERLGKGGMGEVWKAKHILLQGERAIKVIKSSISRDAAFRQRFLREGQTMMRIKHPGVVEVTDLDETRSNRELFMVMEYLKGRTIYDAVRDKKKPLAADVRDAVRILREVAGGMQRIHDARIVHKDLKSDNVLLVKGEDGLEHPKVIDFGLAKSLSDKDADVEKADANSPPASHDPDLRTTLSGTLAYMAPEQFKNLPSSFQSDIYAFGVMAYEVFTNGEFPMPRGSLVEYMKLHESGKAPDPLAKKRPDLDPRLVATFDWCLALKREARPESFQRVADDLQFWLDTPERERRRRNVMLYTIGASVLVAAAVWGAFFAGRTAPSLSQPKVLVAGAQRDPIGPVVYLRGEDVKSLQLVADAKGKPENSYVEIDGRRAPAEHAFDEKTGKLTATLDLSELSDAEHKIAWLAASDSSPANVTIAVDRAPPKVKDVSVAGAVVAKDGATYTHSPAPVVVVDLGEPTGGIREVFALSKDGAKSPGEREAGADRWDIKGTAPGDGKVECDVVVRDFAGNETRRPLAYVCDTKPPSVVIRDEFDAQFYSNRKVTSVHGVWMREARGAQIVVNVSELARVEASFDGGAAVVREGAGDVVIDVPPVPPKGMEVKLTVTDVAGNETPREFHLGQLSDGVRVMDVNASDDQTLTVRGDSSDRPFVIVNRTYPMGDGIELWTEMLRDVDGKTVKGAERRAVHLEFVRADGDKSIVYTVPRGVLPDGVYRLGATLPTPVPVMPLTLTIDSAPPVVDDAVAVEDATTHEPIATWALAPDVVVKVVVSDLALQRIDLGGVKPAEKPAPGRNTYSFRMHLDHEGVTTWTLALADSAGHTAERPITVRGDWTPPEITALDAPRDGASFDDISAVAFVGRCSEARYRLVVRGLPGGAKREANCVEADFSQSFLLPATEGPTALQVVAVDDAGHESRPKTITLNVAHRSTKLAAEMPWKRGVDVLMEKVEQGDLVISACAAAVDHEVFLDKTEVTNAQYRLFLAAVAKDGDAAWRHPEQPKDWNHVPTATTWNDPKWNADDLPVVNVAYWDAYAFAKWTGRRLPTEAEWVKAAAKSSAKGELELRQWPPFCVGTEWKDGVLATAERGLTRPVSALTGDDVSPCQCLHMGGNVSEWVELAADVEGAARAGTRGGNWYFTRKAADVRNTPGKAWDRKFRADTIGFRCAQDADLMQP